MPVIWGAVCGGTEFQENEVMEPTEVKVTLFLKHLTNDSNVHSLVESNKSRGFDCDFASETRRT